MVKNNNDDVNYDDFHAVFTCMQCASADGNALCILARQENNETTTTSENEFSACMGDKHTETADTNVAIMKQLDFSTMVRQS